MIVSNEQLAELHEQVTMVDGGFDPLHPGHVAYFRAAAGLGRPVLCNVASDEWVGRKHPPLLFQQERAEVIDAFRWIEYVHVAQASTASVLRALRPRVYAKGSDWLGRLPDEEVRVCDELQIELVFLDTVTDSSTAILERYEERRAAQ